MSILMLIRFLLALSFFSPIGLSADECDSRSKIATTKELRQQTILSRKACEPLVKAIDEHRSRNLSILEELNPQNKHHLQQYLKLYEVCQADLLKECHPNRNPIKEADLETLFSQFKKNPVYRMRSPEVHCLNRASLLAKELSEKGYKVNILYLRSPSIIGFVKDEKGKPISYFEYGAGDNISTSRGSHYAVSIEVEDSLGRKSEKILDPQFFDEPIDKNKYSQILTGQPIDQTGAGKLYSTTAEYLPPNYDIRMSIPRSMKQLNLNDLCGWHSAEKDLKEIQEVNSSNINLGTPISEADAANLTEDALRKKLRQQELSKLRQKLESDLKYTSDLLEKLNSGQPLPAGILSPKNGGTGLKNILEESFEKTKQGIQELDSIL